MKALRRFFVRLTASITRGRDERRLREEIEEHLVQQTAENIRAGLSPNEARRQAVLKFGAVEEVKEHYRDQTGLPILEHLLHDTRYAVRSLRKNQGFTAVAVLTLALGIGANSAIFSFAAAVLLRPLPFDEPDQLVMVSEGRQDRAERGKAAFLNFVDWREQNQTFESIAAVTGSGVTVQASDGTPEQIPSQSVTADFFRVFRVQPIIGRAFTTADVVPKPNVVVIGERFWRTRLGADPAILGRVLTLNGQPYSVIGVIPASFQILEPSELWTLFSAPPGAPFLRRSRFFDVIGRLKPGVTLETARADIRTVAENIAASSPETNKGWTASVDEMGEMLVGNELRLTSQVLVAVVLCVLLIASANVAGLVLARGASRTREFAVRAALGAGRRRVLMQSFTESLVLASVGGIVGFGLCAGIVRAAPSLIPPGLLPPSVALSLDWRVVAFCAVVSTAVGILFGLAPAWNATRISLTEAIGVGTRGSTTKTGAFRNVVTVAEVAVAVLLLCGAGLLVRTLHSLANVDAGHRAEGVVTARVTLPTGRYNTHERMLRFHESVERELNAVPGVRAAVGTSLPLDGSFFGQLFEIVGDPPAEPSQRPVATYEMVSGRYLDTMGIPIVQGRGFDDGDVTNGTPVCLVSEEFVRRFLAGRNPIGMQVRVSPMTFASIMAPVTREIVGVVRQVKQRPGELREAAQLYVPMAQNSWFAASIVARSEVGRPEALLSIIRSVVAKIEPTLPLTRVRTLEEVAFEANARPRFRAQLVGTFALLALVLAMVGLFGVLAFSVQQRVQEFGVRIAVGANTSDIVHLVLRRTAWITLSGIAFGLAMSAGLSRFLQGLLFGVEPIDLTTFAAVAAVLMMTALGASLAPLMRAARVDPLVALRYE
jgi:putative ABC transport system permease protein